MAMKAKPTPPPATPIKRCQGIVYRGFNVKTQCSKPMGHKGYC